MAKVAELENQLENIETGNPGKAAKEGRKSGGGQMSFNIPFMELPELGMQFLRLTREAKIQEKVFELITSQYELAKIEEAKDVNTIQVLDRAVAPDKKSSPKRAVIVILSTMVSLFLAVLLVFFLEHMARLKQEDAGRWQQLKEGMKLRKK
jgi:capsule polysaccharide export protein KpsE/RkpR